MTFTVICVDQSEIAEEAFDWFAKNVMKDGDEVHCVHVQPPVSIPTVNFSEGVSFPADEISNKLKDRMKKINDLENKYKMKCINLKIKQHKIVFHNGDDKPGEFIVKYATDNKADMIVMGSRGMGTMRRTILGSVSDYVVHHSKIPVLISPKK